MTEPKLSPITHRDLLLDIEARRRELWEQEERIFALAAEGMDQRRRGDKPEQIAATIRFLETQLSHWKTVYHYLKQAERLYSGNTEEGTP